MKKNKAGINPLILFFFILFAISWAVFYYFVFRYKAVPVFNQPNGIQPSSNSVLPPKTFFPFLDKDLKKILTFLIPNADAASNSFPNPGLTTNISAKFPFGAAIETNQVNFQLSGQDQNNPNAQIYFQYFLFPFESSLQTTYGDSAYYYNLPNLVRTYLFFARAADNYGYSAQPKFYIFSTKISPYYKQVYFSASGDGKTIWLSNASQKKIDITGWTIKSMYSNATIPQGVYYVDPYFSNVGADIVLNPGENATLYATNSPIGISYKPNECFSYLQPFYSVNYFGGAYCPYNESQRLIQLKQNYNFSNQCLNAIQELDCSLNNSYALKSILNDYACTNFVFNHFTYSACYASHRDDPNFLESGWSIYLPVSRFNQSRYDVVKLYDRAGLLVNSQTIY